MLRNNNFTFVRLLAAFFVFYSHQFELGGHLAPVWLELIKPGRLGVLMFFSISGFLVADSWAREPKIFKFLTKRFLRIFPALLVLMLLTILVLGSLFTTKTISEYMSHPLTIEYLQNLKLIKVRMYLPGVFEDNPYPGAINGSLWTIPNEVRCYLLLAIAGFAGILKYPRIMLSIFIIFLSYCIFENKMDPNSHFELGAAFMFGVIASNWKFIALSKKCFLFGFLCLGILTTLKNNISHPALVMLIGWVTIYFGSMSTPYISALDKIGDYSYGFYLYSFPMQQIGFSSKLNLESEAYSAVLSFLLTLAFSSLSWHLIEAPFLKIKSGSMKIWRPKFIG